MKLSNKLTLYTCGAAAALVILTGCASSGVKNPSGVGVTRMNADEQGFVAGTGVESQDLVAVTDKMARSILEIPQIGTAPTPPTVSPYLNLPRGGAPAGVNYYGLVRPQMYFQNSIQGLQQQSAGNLNPVVGGAADGSDLPGTGLPVQFRNHGVFFMNLGGGFGTVQPGRGGGTGASPRIGCASAMQSLQSAARAVPPRSR